MLVVAEGLEYAIVGRGRHGGKFLWDIHGAKNIYIRWSGGVVSRLLLLEGSESVRLSPYFGKDGRAKPIEFDISLLY